MTRVTPERLVRLLSAPAVEWRQLVDLQPAAFCQLCDEHGITALVADRLTVRDAGLGAHDPLLALLRERAWQEAALDVVRERDLKHLAAALDAVGVAPLVIKGAHLAYVCYPRPDLRPRVDTDLLIDPTDRNRAASVLSALGYDEAPQSGGDLLMYQVSYERKAAGVRTHVVDLHWRISNAQRFGGCLSHAEILSEAEPIAALHPAVGPSAVHAVILACVHRVAHHLDVPRLVWSYDLHLLGQRLTRSEWDRVATLAIERRVAAACHRSLVGAAALFGEGIPAMPLAALADAARGERGSDDYLDASRPHIHRVLADLRALDSWADRWRLAWQHLFPAPGYMRSVYAPASRAPLALLYLRRAWWGARRWVAHS